MRKRLKNILNAAACAKKGAKGRDRLLIFLLVAFESMSFRKENV